VTQTPTGATPATPKVMARVMTVDELAMLRQVIAEAAASAGLAPDRVGRLTVSVNEIAANAVTHGIPPASVTITVTGTAIMVAVHDCGSGFGQDVPATPAPHVDRVISASPPAPDALRGRGLWLATHMADHISLTTDSGGTTVTVTMAIGPATEP